MKTLFLVFSILSATHLFASGWIQKADFEGVARHRTTMLSIGNHIYVGLGHYNGAGPNILFEDWWAYDPATNAWTQKANYLGGPTYHASGFTIDGIGFVGTGRIDYPSIQLVKSFYKYNPITNMWTQLPNFPGSGRRGGVGFAIDGYGYIGTGSYTSDFYKFDPISETWSPVASMPTTGRISAVGFELDGYGYVGTGYVSGSSTDFWRYDPVLDQWQQMANVGPTPRMEASGFALGGKGYILTGDNYSSGTNYGDMWEYDPPTNTWTQIEDFAGSKRRYLSSITHGNFAYSGLGTNGTNFVDFWLFDQTLSLLSRKKEDIQLSSFPNPFDENISIEVQGLEGIAMTDLYFTVVTFTGEEVLRQRLESMETKISTSQLRPGTYLVNLVYNDQVFKSVKMIKIN